MSWGVGHFGLGAWGHCIGGGPDLDLPVLSLQSPANGATFVPNNTPLKFRLTDTTSPIDLASVQVFVTQGQIRKQVVMLGVFVPPYNSGSSATANASQGFDFVIIPNSLWVNGATIVVDLQATDSFCNTLTASWSFEIAPCYGCVT
jgi:hypothetical protein